MMEGLQLHEQPVKDHASPKLPLRTVLASKQDTVNSFLTRSDHSKLLHNSEFAFLPSTEWVRACSTNRRGCLSVRTILFAMFRAALYCSSKPTKHHALLKHTALQMFLDKTAPASLLQEETVTTDSTTLLTDGDDNVDTNIVRNNVQSAHLATEESPVCFSKTPSSFVCVYVARPVPWSLQQ